MNKIVVLSDADNVATCLVDLDADARIEITLDGETRAITVRDAIPFGHKLAIRPLAAGEDVLKYGENIDVDVSAILTAGEDLDSAGERVWDQVLRMAGGRLTSCEVLQEQQLSVSRFGPSV